MVQRLDNWYRPTQNQVLLHYQIHGLCQKHREKIDSFINKIRWHAGKCSFKRTNPNCTEKEKIHKTRIQDQIIIGTSIRSIREEVLKKENELNALITQAWKIKATEEAVRKLDTNKEATALTAGLNKIHVYDSESDSDNQEVTINKIGKQGEKYSSHNQWKKQFWHPKATSKLRCIGCGDLKYDYGPRCRAQGRFWNICSIKDHFCSVCLTHHKDVSTLTTIRAAMVKDKHKIQKLNIIDITLEGCQIQAMINTCAEV